MTQLECVWGSLRSTGQNQGEVVLGVCTAVRREGLLLVEWIEYHSMIGIKNFYIYIPLLKVMDPHEAAVMDSLLQPYRHSDTIKVHILYQERPKENFTPQAQAMDLCYQNHAKLNDWLFFFDVDEFLAFSADQKNLKSILSKILNLSPYSTRNPWAAVCITRVNIFPAHPFNDPMVNRPFDSLLTESANRSSSTPANGKIAAYTHRSTRHVRDCHFASTIEADPAYHHNCFAGSNAFVVFTNGAIVRRSDTHCRSTEPSEAQKLVLYHYFVRTCAEWRELLLKRTDWNKQRGFPLDPQTNRYNPEFCVKASNNTALAEADLLQRYLPELKNRVRKHPLWGQRISFV